MKSYQTVIKELRLGINLVARYLNVEQFSKFHEAAGMAIKACKKQIPKKVVVHGFDPNKLISTVSYTCPVCHTHVSESEYCSNCGQALKFERK